MPRRIRAAAQRVDQRRQDARAGGADGMAQGACAAVDVHARVIDVDVAHGGHGHGGEGFVDLVEIRIVRLPAELRRESSGWRRRARW